MTSVEPINMILPASLDFSPPHLINYQIPYSQFGITSNIRKARLSPQMTALMLCTEIEVPMSHIAYAVKFSGSPGHLHDYTVAAIL